MNDLLLCRFKRPKPRDLERVRVSLVVAYRHVFTFGETVCAQTNAGLSLARVLTAVTNGPGSTLAATQVDEPAMPIAFAGPEPSHATLCPVVFPFLDIEMRRRIERRDKFISSLGTAFGKFGAPREMKGNMLKHVNILSFLPLVASDMKCGLDLAQRRGRRREFTSATKMEFQGAD
ncbi:hypothetical protein [Methylovirgula sp. 4M-Z18]|uniref:hypothetical protein n=1 Tax=Methylovirgula sp. 4M-Z18 TaxID=2293567 RepID=UPI0013141EA4|nr:hypothetical protein [Methylovirgula sp. 4M-Z18]